MDGTSASGATIPAVLRGTGDHERDGETWECDYDCMFGAGFDDIH